MATLFETDFETGTIGAAMANGSSGFDAAVGATAKCSYVAGFRGSVGMRSTTGATGEQRSMTKIFAGLISTVCIRAYVKMSTAVGVYVLQLQTASAARAILHVNADGSVRCRTGAAAALGAANIGSGAINATTETRVEWLVTATTQRVRLFTGSNKHGTTPDYDSGDLSWTPTGTFDRFTVGVVSGTANVTLDWDDVKVDDTTWVGPAATNVAPTANAGSDQTVGLGATVSLSGSGSDSDGTISSYAWSWTSRPGGSSASFSSASSQNTNFTPDITGVYVARLTVTDDLGATGTDDVQITVNSSDSANAGSDQSVAPWSTVTLSGTGSSAGAWSQISGPAAALGGSGAVRTFEAVPGNTPGGTVTRTFRYTVGAATDDMVVTTQSASVFVGSVASPKAVKVQIL